MEYSVFFLEIFDRLCHFGMFFWKMFPQFPLEFKADELICARCLKILLCPLTFCVLVEH